MYIYRLVFLLRQLYGFMFFKDFFLGLKKQRSIKELPCRKSQRVKLRRRKKVLFFAKKEECILARQAGNQ
jgi:hypothetical protein